MKVREDAYAKIQKYGLTVPYIFYNQSISNSRSCAVSFPSFTIEHQASLAYLTREADG